MSLSEAALRKLTKDEVIALTLEYQAKFNEKLQDTATRYILFLFVLHQLLHQQISFTTFWNFFQHYLKKKYQKFSIWQIHPNPPPP